jgi:chemotaxis protein CheD
MIDSETELEEVYLQPGEMFLAREPTIIRTLLGSCVGVTFWSRRLGIGALCHAMLPRCPESSLEAVSPKDGYRYVDFAIRDIGRKLDELGVHRSEVEVKVFGGADVLLGEDMSLIKPSLGNQNCDSAFDVLQAEGFQVMASSLRGTSGLKLHFYTESGDVLVRRDGVHESPNLQEARPHG